MKEDSDTPVWYGWSSSWWTMRGSLPSRAREAIWVAIIALVQKLGRVWNYIGYPTFYKE